MTKENFTSINVIIDRSGSMRHLTNDTIGGFNSFLADQKLAPGSAVFTLCLFSDHYNMVHSFKDINEVSDLNNETYSAGGGTALLDALGTVIDETGVRLAGMPEEERPSKVIVLVITDGQENASKKYTKARVKEMISHQEEKYNWTFIFMGANIDAVSEGASIGIAAHNSIQYSASASGTGSLYANVSKGLRRARVYGAAMTSNQRFLNQEELQSLVDPVKVDNIPGTVDAAGPGTVDPAHVDVSVNGK